MLSHGKCFAKNKKKLNCTEEIIFLHHKVLNADRIKLEKEDDMIKLGQNNKMRIIKWMKKKFRLYFGHFTSMSYSFSIYCILIFFACLGTSGMNIGTWTSARGESTRTRVCEDKSLRERKRERCEVQRNAHAFHS